MVHGVELVMKVFLVLKWVQKPVVCDVSEMVYTHFVTCRGHSVVVFANC